ncbi:MAG: sigma-54-dependent Fis family transcriptional regulator [Ignavibacteriales bacterium]|nr:sigma-54-dependent Fis family transcriptional regulator [Ignavibacteriales bacterium]
MNNLNLLIIDDEEKTRQVLEINLQSAHNVILAKDGREALALLQSEPIDIVLTDLKMPDVDGQTVMKEVRKMGRSIPVIIMTAFGTVDNAVSMMKEGAFDYLTKPVDLDQLDLVLARAINHVKLIRENEELRSQLRSIGNLSNIITASSKMQYVLKTIQQIASTNFTVLIEGETGTGKELVARAIHSSSQRSAKTFVDINCGAIPRELLESEFFGSEKGAFTGATNRRLGKFEQANGGTLFLDEIGELPIELQVKLLRAIEEQAIVRVGGNERISLDLRIIAATNRKLKAEVEEGRFRSDLYYRLNVVNIVLPPLGERAEDIPLLAQHFLMKHKKNVGKDIKGFDPAVLIYLKRCPWRGNVRELDNVVVRSMVAASEEYITIEDLPADLHIGSNDEQESIPSSYQEYLSQKKILKDKHLREFEKNFILEALRNNHWNISQTARALDMDRRLLQNMMKEHGLKFKENEL